MDDNNTIELDEKTLDNVEKLAKEAGMSKDAYLRKLLFDRAAEHLKQQETGRSLFFAANGGVPPLSTKGLSVCSRNNT